jgi:hypothetical protein
MRMEAAVSMRTPRARNASPQNFVEARALGRERGGGMSVRWRKGAHGFTLHRGGRGPALASFNPL